MKLKLGCFKKAEAGAIDQEQQLGTENANLGENMAKVIVSDFVV